MNKRRLLKLADLLDADAKNKKGVQFDLTTWAGKVSKRGELPEVSCGTQACAMGLAVISGAFKRAGLTALYDKNYIGLGYAVIPKFGRKAGYAAAESLFDISAQQARHLFSPAHYENRKGAKAEMAVAQRIRQLVATTR